MKNMTLKQINTNKWISGLHHLEYELAKLLKMCFIEYISCLQRDDWEKRCRYEVWHWYVRLSGPRRAHTEQPFPLKSVMSGQIFLRRSVSDGQDTLVLLSWASPVQALASRKSPLRTAILFPNCMSFSGPSESVHSFKLTIPRCTRKAVWINSVISARFLWLWDRNPPTKNNNKSKNHSFVVSSF